MSRRAYLIEALEEVGYRRQDIDWWGDYALEYEYEQLTGECLPLEADEEDQT